MGRKPRIITRPGALVEIVNRTCRGTFLLKPDPTFNAVAVGALAKARQAEPGVRIYGGAFASSHFHLIISAPSVRAQAAFMRTFTHKLSIECGKLHGWDGSVFPNRYRCTEISDEPTAQLARLGYCLGHGCKENLVSSPLDWPGVPFAEALISGEPLRGIWIDRTGYQRARDRGTEATLEDFTEQQELVLDPLPGLKDFDLSQRRQVVLGLIRKIEEETAARHKKERTAPLGAAAVVSAHPNSRSARLKTSPKPLFHAFRREVWVQMREAMLVILSAYREASARLRSGYLDAVFPDNTFPPALPFLEPVVAAAPPG